MMHKKSAVLFSIALLLSFSLIGSGACGQVNEVSDPGKANKILSDFSTPIIRPGKSGNLAFNVSNRYEGGFSDIEFTAEIYGYANLDLEKDIAEVEHPPIFKSSGTTAVTHRLSPIPSNDTFPNRYTLKTDRRTEKGVYFVRFRIEFTYDPTGNESVMKSKGYFGDSLWENATKRPGATDEPYYAGSINITLLEVNGILPDTSFSVKTPIPRWPQYLLAGLSAFFGIMAVMLYMQEEYNSFPWLEKVLNEWSGKFKQFRRRLEHRLGKP